MKKNIVLSLSGGMDSSTLLLHCLKHYENVTAISFDYGQKHRVELDKASQLVEYLNSEGFKRFNSDNPSSYNKINHHVITLDGLSELLNSTLVNGGDEVPEGHYAEENMKLTVVPNRNKIFSSIIQAVALSIGEKNGEGCDIALGIHAGDHFIYADCREEFRNADLYAFRVGNENSHLVNYYTPYLNGDKFSILKEGEELCDYFGLDFDIFYSLTNTSYKPIQFPVTYNNGIVIKEWFSDYKSASSVERIEAFIKLNRKDPVCYADEYGPVTWEVAKNHVLNILNIHGEKA